MTTNICEKCGERLVECVCAVEGHITRPMCEMQDCGELATIYGGYAGANEWAGRVCERHSHQLAWKERLR